MKTMLKIRTIGWLVVVGLVFGTGAASADPKPKDTLLNGTLAIDFQVPDVNPDLPTDFRFTVTMKSIQIAVFGNLPIPAVVKGGTFELNAPGCTGTDFDGTSGGALLRVQHKGKGTLYRSNVTSGAAACLLEVGATRVDAPFDDPFKGPVTTLEVIYGEIAIWDTQILV